MALDQLTSRLLIVKKFSDEKYGKVKDTMSGLLLNSSGDNAAIRRQKTWLELVMLSCAVCGIELCYAAETALVSPILLKLGIPVTYMTLVWCVSPLLGLFFSPLIGSFSDQCRSRLGRRRPFILLLSVGIMIGLILVPHGREFGFLLGDPDPNLRYEINCQKNDDMEIVRGDRVSQDKGKSSSSQVTQTVRYKGHLKLPKQTTTPFKIKFKEKYNWDDNGLFLDHNEDDFDSNRDKRTRFRTEKRMSRSKRHINYSKSKLYSRTLANSHSISTTPAPTNLSLEYLKDQPDNSPCGRSGLWSILFTIIGVALLDSCCDACQSPCRTYLLDVSQPSDHARGLSTFTVMAGLGGSIGYLIGGIDWGSVGPGADHHDSMTLWSHVKVVFGFVTVCYVILVFLTLLSVKEIPLGKHKNDDDGGSKFKFLNNEYNHKRFSNYDDKKKKFAKRNSKKVVKGKSADNVEEQSCLTSGKRQVISYGSLNPVKPEITVEYVQESGNQPWNWNDYTTDFEKSQDFENSNKYGSFSSARCKSVSDISPGVLNNQSTHCTNNDVAVGFKGNQSSPPKQNIWENKSNRILGGSCEFLHCNTILDEDLNHGSSSNQPERTDNISNLSALKMHLSSSKSTSEIYNTKTPTTASVSDYCLDQPGIYPELILSSETLNVETSELAIYLAELEETSKLTRTLNELDKSTQEPITGMDSTMAFEEPWIENTVTTKMYLQSLIHMPRSILLLCITNFFCWASLISYSLYFTDFVGQVVYGGDPDAPLSSPAHRAYDRGVMLGSLAMSLYSISCSVYSASIERIVKLLGARKTYVLSQLVYTMGAGLMVWFRSPMVCILLSPCPGIMYATLFTMPYILLAHYHSNNQFEDKQDGGQVDEKSHKNHPRRLGTDVAVVSSMVFVAQFFLSAVLGSFVHWFGSPSVVMVTAAIFSFCGALTATQLTYAGL